MNLIEKIEHEGRILAYIIPSTARPERTTFLTPPEDKQQVGFVVYPGGGTIKRHYHKPMKREIHGTSEVLVVRSGLCEVDLYDTHGDERKLVTTKTLKTGDVLVLVSGGHGFRVKEDTVFLEVKQGPYLGMDDKEAF
jgi:hypothetical protein